MIENPYENLFCDKCKNKIVIDGEDRCNKLNSFVMSNHYCSQIFRCRHFENKNKKQLTKQGFVDYCI